MGEALKDGLLISCLLLLLFHDFSKHTEHDSERTFHLGEVHAARYIEELTKGKLCLCDVSSK